MHFSKALIALVAAGAVEAIPQLLRTPQCRTPSPSQEHLDATHAQIAEYKAALASRDTTPKGKEEKYEIDIYFHVVAKSDKVEDGYIAVRPTLTEYA